MNSQEKKIEGFKQLEKSNTSTFSDIQLSQMENLRESYQELKERFEETRSRMKNYEEENKTLEEEVAYLKGEISASNTPKPHKFELPANFMQFDELSFRRSI